MVHTRFPVRSIANKNMSRVLPTDGNLDKACFNFSGV